MPDTASPDTENPYLDKPDTEKPAELNIEKSNTPKIKILMDQVPIPFPFRETAAVDRRNGKEGCDVVAEMESYRD